MSDQSHPDAGGGSDRVPSGGSEPPDGSTGAVLPAALLSDVSRLSGDGDALVLAVLPWVDRVQSAFHNFDAIAKSLHLSDGDHQLLATASGISHLYDVLEDLAGLVDPTPVRES